MQILTDKTWWVYIAQCNDGTLYTGISVDVVKRIATHNAGKGAKYTRSRRPITLKMSSLIGTHSDALKIERQIKKLKRIQKEHIIKEFETNKCLSTIIGEISKSQKRKNTTGS